MEDHSLIDEARKSARYQKVTIRMAGGKEVAGRINTGDNKRISDFLNHSGQRFIPVVPISKEEELIIINRDEIVWIAPE